MKYLNKQNLELLLTYAWFSLWIGVSIVGLRVFVIWFFYWLVPYLNNFYVYFYPPNAISTYGRIELCLGDLIVESLVLAIIIFLCLVTYKICSYYGELIRRPL